MIAVNVVFALLSILTGWLVVARSHMWTFPCGIKPYLEGDRRAYIYLVTVVSMLIASSHMLLLLGDIMVDQVPPTRGLLYLTISILTCGVHLWVWRTEGTYR